MTNNNVDEKRVQEIEKNFSASTHFNISSDSDFNNSIDHIIGLLTDSFTLITNSSYGSALFLAITAMEETAKTHFAMFMKHDLNINNNKDPLMKHYKKHFLSVSPVFKMGSRLTNVLGNEKIDEFISLIDQKNGLMDLRNNSIYWHTDSNGNYFPKDSIDKNIAQEMLLFSIESFDDSLVGYSQYSIEASDCTDTIFESIKKDYHSK